MTAGTDELNKEMTLVMLQVRQVVTRPSIHRIATSMEFGGTGSSSGSSAGPLPWVESVPLLVGAIVWGIGILRIVLNRSMARE